MAFSTSELNFIESPIAHYGIKHLHTIFIRVQEKSVCVCVCVCVGGGGEQFPPLSKVWGRGHVPLPVDGHATLY